MVLYRMSAYSELRRQKIKMMAFTPIILLGILLALLGALKRRETYGKMLLGLGIIITAYFIYAICSPLK